MSLTVHSEASQFQQKKAFAVGGGTVCCFTNKQGVFTQPSVPTEIVSTLQQGPFALHETPTYKQCMEYIDFLEATHVISNFEVHNFRAAISDPPTKRDLEVIQGIFKTTNPRYCENTNSINRSLNDVKVVVVNTTFSEDITDEKADEIVAQVAQLFEEGCEGVLLTFGTDAVDRMLNDKLEKWFNEYWGRLSQRKDANGRPMSAVVMALTADNPLEVLYSDGWSNVALGINELERLLNSKEQHIGSFLPFHDRLIKGGNIVKSPNVNPAKITDRKLLISFLELNSPFDITHDDNPASPFNILLSQVGNPYTLPTSYQRVFSLDTTLDNSARLRDIWLRSRSHMTFMSRDSDEFRLLQEIQQHIKENQIENLRRMFNGKGKYDNDSVLVYHVNKFIDNHNDLYSRIKPDTKSVIFVLNHSGTTYTNEDDPERCVAALAKQLHNEYGISSFAVTENAESFNFYQQTYPGGLLLGNYVTPLSGMIAGVAKYKAQLLCSQGYDNDYLVAAMLSSYVGELDNTALSSYKSGGRHLLAPNVCQLPKDNALDTEFDASVWMDPIPAVALQRLTSHTQMINWLGRERFLRTHEVVALPAV